MSPDLNPCDLYLWGYLQDRMFQKSPWTTPELKHATEDEILSVLEEALVHDLRNFTLRLKHIIDKYKGHIEHVMAWIF
jgi:hypothetical protein